MSTSSCSTIQYRLFNYFSQGDLKCESHDQAVDEFPLQRNKNDHALFLFLTRFCIQLKTHSESLLDYILNASCNPQLIYFNGLSKTAFFQLVIGFVIAGITWWPMLCSIVCFFIYNYYPTPVNSGQCTKIKNKSKSS